MNKVITINLGGVAYQLEEAGYDALRAYLDTANARLQSNPDRAEIISDIERAIGEKFRGLLGSFKTVVETHEVTAVLAQMGPIEGDPSEAGDPKAGATGGAGASGTGAPPLVGHSGPPRRLYRIEDGAMWMGVCNGVAAYVNVDPTFVRLAFVFLTILWGTGALVYIVMAIVLPEARTPEEIAAASGSPFTAQEFIRRAKEGYYGAMKGFPDRQSRREWKRRFKSQMRGCTDQWRYNWHSYWAQHVPSHPGMGFALPFFSLLHGAMTVIWFSTLISLLATGTLFGVVLPDKMPVWLAVVILMMIYGMLTAPLKIARRACAWGMGQPSWTWPVVYLLDAIIWVAVFVILFWLAFHYFPDVRSAVQTVPTLFHQAVADIQNWWNTK
jgi:phage shock protein PspC (stress-responsive transcriptional regulator)